MAKTFSEWFDSPDAVSDSAYRRGAAPMADEEGDQHREITGDDNRWEYLEHQDRIAKSRKESNEDVQHITKYVEDSKQINDNLIRIHKAGQAPTKENVATHNDEERARKLFTKADSAHIQSKHFEAMDRLTKSQSSKGMEKYKLYTGVGGGIDVHEARKAGGDRVHFPAFTSASAEPSVAAKFAKKLDTTTGESRLKKHREMIEIHVDPKQHPNVGYHLGHHNGIESEYLLRHGMTLKFHGDPVHVEHEGAIYKIHKASIEGFRE